MDARISNAAVLAAVIISLGAGYRTPNFIVNAPTPQMAEQIGKAAEQYRKQLALEWLGKEMPTWAEPCPITAQVGDRLGAGGATSFLFEHGEVYGWQMSIQGSLERILDSVLPHEVTHTIFATHFRRPLPRWADEGACTTVEHASERGKQSTMLVDFLKTNRGIAFNKMFAMKEYPRDVLPLYSQGYSLARYLIAQGGKRKFLKYLADGMRDENWAGATASHYGYADLSILQNAWLDWVRKGSPALESKPEPAELAAPTVAQTDGRRDRPAPNLIYRAGDEAGKLANDGRAQRPPAPTPYARTSQTASASWHPARQSKNDSVDRQVDSVASDDCLAGEQVAVAREDDRNMSEPTAYQATRQQSVQPSRQIILEWSRPRQTQ